MTSPTKFVWPLVAAIAIAGGSYFGSLALNHSIASAESPAATARPTPSPALENISAAQDLSRNFREVHNAMKDAVVNISIVKKSPASNFHSRIRIPDGFPLPPGFNPNDLNPDGGDSGGEEIQGTGSGVIVSPDGYILTNNHVVEDATDISVRLDDHRTLKAKVIGTDPKTDLAVIKIDADHLTYAKFGDSDEIQVGDWVLAFGSPMGYEQSMTQGIISAKGRQIGIIASHNPALQDLTYEDFLQTDAAINPGNSGGPLVNLKGEVIGINSAIASTTGAYSGIGFSIPSNEARYIMDSLIKHGKVVRGFLQVQIEDINNPTKDDQALADSIKRSGFSGNGVLVNGVGPDGPAAKGGVQAGDVIVALNGKPVESVGQLRNQIARTAPGTEIALTIYRDGKNLDLKFPVGTQPATIAAADQGGNSVIQAPAESKDLGLSVVPVDDTIARKYHVPAGKGVAISEIDPNGLAAQCGLNAGDVITRVDRTPVNSPDAFSAAISKANLNDGVRLHVHTGGMDRLIFVQKTK
ncbi:MAG TPA: Do family serine endopeptidase [Phycisphaerae bacterium]|nr:Do family serine endopeptidase [Phycisphaerae bacterium]